MEFSGKTIDLAIKEGLKVMGASLEDVDVKIISEGGLFKKAKVDITRSKKEELPKEEKKEVKKATKPAKEEKVVVEEVVEATEEVVEEKPKKKEYTEEEKQAIEKMVADVKNYIKEYMDKMCYIFNQIGETEIVEQGRDLKVNLKASIRPMIGYHGESLEAYQTLLNSAIANRYPHFRGRVYLDVDNYKGGREQSLTSLAKRMANKVVVARRSMKLEPMKSFERKIIHNVLSGMAHIDTHSEGEEPKRYIVIDYVE